MVATAQRFSEMNPEIDIRWEKRTLQEFADHPLEKLVDTFDLLVIDHPFSGHAAAHPALLPWMSTFGQTSWQNRRTSQ